MHRFVKFTIIAIVILILFELLLLSGYNSKQTGKITQKEQMPSPTTPFTPVVPTSYQAKQDPTGRDAIISSADTYRLQAGSGVLRMTETGNIFYALGAFDRLEQADESDLIIYTHFYPVTGAALPVFRIVAEKSEASALTRIKVLDLDKVEKKDLEAVQDIMNLMPEGDPAWK